MSLNQVIFAKESTWETMNSLSYSKKVMFINHEEYSSHTTIKNSL